MIWTIGFHSGSRQKTIVNIFDNNEKRILKKSMILLEWGKKTFIISFDHLAEINIIQFH